MIDLSPPRAGQIICTGVTICCITGTILGLAYVISYGKYELKTNIGRGAPFWAGIPTILTGIFGILAGVFKKRILLKLFLVLSTVSLVLGILITAVVGLMLKEWRSKGDCKYTFCPFDEVSILMIILVVTWVLMSIMALTGILEASFPLVCQADNSAPRNDGRENGHYRGYLKQPGFQGITNNQELNKDPMMLAVVQTTV